MTSFRRISLWVICLLVVLGLHGAIAMWSLYWKAEPAETPVAPPPAMMLQLAPLPAAPPPPPPPPPPAPPTPPEPTPLPKLAEAPKPKIAVPVRPKPTPKPQPPRPKPPEPTPPAPEQPPAPPLPHQSQAQAAPAAPEASSVPAPANTQAIDNWQSRLMAHLNRRKVYPDDARRRGMEGTVRLRFVIDGSGKVLSYSVIGSSGRPSLDRAALQMIRRASPVPAPPPEILSGGRKEITAPIVYSLRRN